MTTPAIAIETAPRRENDRLIKHAFTSYLAITILITLSATLGMMLDTVMAGNFIGPDAVAAIGMSSSVLILVSGLAGILGAGSMTLAAKAVGQRDAQTVSALFSVTFFATVGIGVALSAAGAVFAGDIATLLGAVEGDLHANTANFLRGLCSGAFAIMLLQVMMGLTRVDNAPTLGLAAILAMSACDVCGNLVAILVLDLGTLGMGYATAIAYCIGAALCCTRLFAHDTMLKFVNPLPHLGKLARICNTGMPDSIGRLSVTARTFAFNRLLIVVAGSSAVTALSMLASVNSFLSAVTIGTGETAVLLYAVFYGEQDRASIEATTRVALRIGLALCVCISALAFAFAPQVVGIFGLTDAKDVENGVAAIRFFTLSVPIDLIITVAVNFYRCIGNLKAANIITFAQSFAGSTLVALCAVWFLGASGVWVAFAAGEGLTLAGVAVWAARKTKRDSASHGIQRLFAYPNDMQAEWIASASYSCEGTMESVVACSRSVAQWCEQYGIDARRTYLVSLAVEEMAGNIVEHGAPKRGTARIDVKLIAKTDRSLTLRLRDNGREFNPLDYDLQAHDATSCIGITMIRKLISNMEYQNAMGLNNLVFELPGK